MSYLAKLSTGTHPETGRLTRSWVYEEVSAGEIDLWRRHQALLDPENPRKHEAKVADLSADDFHDQLRTHMRMYSKPPMLIHTDDGRTSISPPITKVWIQPTPEQLQVVDVSKPDVEGWLDLDWVQHQGSASLRAPASNPINTTLSFTCLGLISHHTDQGWTVYEGDIKCGLRIDPSSYQENDATFKGLRSYLSNNRTENQHLQLRLTTVEPGDHMTLTSLSTAQGSANNGSDFDRHSPVITLTGTARSVPTSDRITFQGGTRGLDVLRVHDETFVRVSSIGEPASFRRAQSRVHFAIPAVLACEIPAVSHT